MSQFLEVLPLPQNPSSPKSALFFAHGYGSTAGDALPLLNIWSQSFPDMAFFAVNAPFACEEGGIGSQWFSLRHYVPQEWNISDTFRDEALSDIAAAKEKLWDTLKHYSETLDLPLARFILGGFSQGAIMTLETLTTLKEPLLCMLAFSGGFITKEEKIPTATPNISKAVPTALSYGTADPIIIPAMTRAASDCLSSKDYNVKAFSYEGEEHTISPAALADATTFIKTIL